MWFARDQRIFYLMEGSILVMSQLVPQPLILRRQQLVLLMRNMEVLVCGFQPL